MIKVRRDEGLKVVEAIDHATVRVSFDGWREEEGGEQCRL